MNFVDCYLQFRLNHIVVIVNLCHDVIVHFVDCFRWNAAIILDVLHVAVHQMLNIVGLLQNHIFSASHLIHNVI